MLNTQPLQSMYSPSGVHFRNPFSSQSFKAQSHLNYDENPSPSSGHGNKISLAIHRPLTPPPEMSTVASNVQHSQYPYYGDRPSGPMKYETGHIKYEPALYNSNQTLSNTHVKQETLSQPSSRPRSPVFTQNPNTGGTRKDSQMNSIAPSLQIPRSVNNSQGSLAELAAQITCLFWFESSATLERAENNATYHYPLHALVPDAIPTTGFRKWVTTILSTTQVAQNVIILALLFVYRLKKLNPTVKGKPGSEYRLLTVALMLGNKFLDDNTYTNKTWAEVSGISVSEVHIMEVEFLSNMKYALFTSAEEWDKWQTQLGRFANFFEQASRVPTSHSTVSALGITLPSPPASTHASPPYTGNQPLPQHSNSAPIGIPSHGTTPNPSPLGPIPALYSQPNSRKRSLDATSTEHPAKRLATPNTNYGQSYASSSSTAVPAYSQSQFLPRVPLPSLAIPPSQQQLASNNQTASSQQQQQQQFVAQLPPLNYSQRLHATNDTPTTTWAQSSSVAAPASNFPQAPMQIAPAPIAHSRHQSPYPGSAGVSPINGVLQSAGQAHSSQLSPSYYLEQRNSPYRPIRSVSTLLVPPPQRTREQPQHVEREQMHYQPLGRPQERQTGQLPYIAQNQWFDGHHQSTASAYQWPSFLPSHTQHHPQLPLPTPSFGRT